MQLSEKSLTVHLFLSHRLLLDQLSRKWCFLRHAAQQLMIYQPAQGTFIFLNFVPFILWFQLWVLSFVGFFSRVYRYPLYQFPFLKMDRGSPVQPLEEEEKRKGERIESKGINNFCDMMSTRVDLAIVVSRPKNGLRSWSSDTPKLGTGVAGARGRRGEDRGGDALTLTRSVSLKRAW